ncbi:MAG: alpha/beta hydrolase [Bradyrhizobium sp.]|uniref:alpha/beta fold hydrolase n=1 Tax=Bradyrhizobium sp. TaxID=376 RepID=UPI001D6E309F|nr:alpha/beta hydrolase [Bradyrhizobium sp.]MBV9561722.1 alpha/beta hydrolase [Bradyrhizobium sp.]
MQTLRVNGYDMAYLEVGNGDPLVCVHGTLGDFRTWHGVVGPLSRKHRVIALSLRHFFPAHWDGVGDDYKMAQHVDDVIAFIEQIEPKPVDLMGHSRGGHIAFRVAQQRPGLLRKLVLAEPGGELDTSLDPSPPVATPQPTRIAISAEMIRAGDIDGALQNFFDGIDGDGAWARLPAAPRQQLRDNVFTLLGQVNENRRPYSKADAQSIRTPTLFVGGADTKGHLPAVTRALAPEVAGARSVMIAGARHWMFEQAPEAFSRIVMEFLAA